MRYLFELICVLALSVMPMAGCSDDGGVGGSGGSAGSGGSGGGTAGAGGMAGTGGSEPSPVGLWTGSGQDAPDGPLTICFNVREDGGALVASLDTNQECQGWSLWVEFENCEGAFLTNEEIPIVDGAFNLLLESLSSNISGTFDGNTASGEATTLAVGGGTCAGTWQASPSP